jgi:inorganic pyrophosphatase
MLGGSVAAVLSASICIVLLSTLYVLCYALFVSHWGVSAIHVPILLGGFGFGASFIACFM